MFTIDRTLEINAPAEQVWQVLTDFARYGDWNPFVPQAHCDLRIGGALKMQVVLKKQMQQTEYINAVTPGKSFAYSMKPAPLGALRSLRVQTVEPIDAMRCRYISHFEIGGWLNPVVSLAMGAPMRQGFEAMAQGLKAQAEKLNQSR